MILKNPIVLVVNNESVELSSLNIVITDDAERKLVLARLASFLSPIVLWRGNNYDSIGDYTQAQVEDKVLEILSNSSLEKLQSLVI